MNAGYAVRASFWPSTPFAVSPILKKQLRNSQQSTVWSPSMSKYATSAASSPGLTWIENVRLSCSLKTVGVIDAPEKPLSPPGPTERRS